MQSIQVQFENDGGRTLSGTLDMPKTPTADFALFAHCFTCSKDIAAAGFVPPTHAPARRKAP